MPVHHGMAKEREIHHDHTENRDQGPNRPRDCVFALIVALVLTLLLAKITPASFGTPAAFESESCQDRWPERYLWPGVGRAWREGVGIRKV